MLGNQQFDFADDICTFGLAQLSDLIFEGFFLLDKFCDSSHLLVP